MANNVINLTNASITFSDASNLNIVPSDLDKSMLSVSYDEDPVNSVKAPLAVVKVLRFLQIADITINLLKTSVRFAEYSTQIYQDASLGGTATITLDNGASFVVKDLSIARGEYGMGDDVISSTFILRGSVDVNIASIAGVI